MARIPKWLVVIVSVNVLAIAGAVVTVNVLDPSVQATCDNAISLYFDDDPTMRAAAEKLRSDRRVGDVAPETGEQARHRLEQWPRMDTLYPADTAPAVHLAAKDADRTKLIASLQSELKGVHGARAADCTTQGKRTEAQLVAFDDALRCSRRLFVWLADDVDLEPATHVLRNDPRVDQVKAVTEAEVYQRIRELAKDEPEFAKVGPEDVQARLDIAASGPAEARGLVEDAKRKLPHVEAADVLPCFAVPNPLVPAPK